MEEEIEQKTTFLLTEIDTQFSRAHEAATRLLRSVRKHGNSTKQLHAHCLLFQELFIQLQDKKQVPSSASKRRYQDIEMRDEEEVQSQLERQQINDEEYQAIIDM